MENTTQHLYLSLGSNQGDRLQYMIDAIQCITEEEVGIIINYSSVYESISWGFKGNNFYNSCIEITYNKDLSDILTRLQFIEYKLGRERLESTQNNDEDSQAKEYHNRTIDIDILWTSDPTYQIIEHPRLTLPHPRLHLRQFVLKPLYEIAPDWIHPISGKSIKLLLQECNDFSEIRCLRGFDLERLVINDL